MNKDNKFKHTDLRNEVEEINIGDLGYTLLKNWWVILIFACAMCAMAFFYTKMSYEPSFTAKASMVINSMQATMFDGQVTMTNDISLSEKMVNTYSTILISDNVLEKVNEKINKSIPTTLLRSFIKVTSPADSQVIMVEVTSLDPQESVDVANGIMEVAPSVISETVEVGTITVLDYAKLPDDANPPKYFMNEAIGMLLGICFGVFLVVLSMLLYPKIRNKREIHEHLKLHVLGEIPRNSNSKGKVKVPLITDDNVSVLFIEAFKLLGVHIKNVAAKNNFKKFLVTSAFEHEGKTTVSSNLSLTLAKTGSSVLFVEGDVYNANSYRRLDKKISWLHTFSDTSEDGVVLKFCIAKYSGLDLYILPLKSSDDDSGKSFNEEEIYQVIGLLENKFDFVIFDSPPAFILSDAAILSKYADGIILTVRQEQGFREMIQETKNTLESSGATIIGCVLNDVRDGRRYYKNKYKYKYKYKSPFFG